MLDAAPTSGAVAAAFCRARDRLARGEELTSLQKWPLTDMPAVRNDSEPNVW